MTPAEADLQTILEVYQRQLPKRDVVALDELCTSYLAAVRQGGSDIAEGCRALIVFFELLRHQVQEPYHFEVLHRSQRSPFDYYRFGQDFIRPLVDMPHSKVIGDEHLDTIQQQIERGENVLFLANHQIEADAQILCCLLEQKYPKLAEQLVFVAGHRVVQDPWAVPFSRGHHLLCIWSKKYIDANPAEKRTKLEHNRSAIKALQLLLDQGGAAVYVAPSGGRDRPDSQGQVDVAPFDPQSVELFFLAARHSRAPTHIYPLALATYALLPPPSTVLKELGEPRHVHWTPVHLAVGQPWTDIDPIPSSQRPDRAHALWETVRSLYQRITY